MRVADLIRYEVRVSSPLSLQASEPEPDIAVITRDAPRPHHPATATLIVEVALYAAAGVDDCWVVDLDGRRVVVQREPSARGYGELCCAGAGRRDAARPPTEAGGRGGIIAG